MKKLNSDTLIIFQKYLKHNTLKVFHCDPNLFKGLSQWKELLNLMYCYGVIKIVVDNGINTKEYYIKQLLKKL